MRELVHRRHIKNTLGTTLKGHYRIVQYREIQYIEGDYIHTTMTQWTGEDRVKTQSFARCASGRNIEATA